MILAFSPPNIPRLHETTLEGRVFLFSLFISSGNRSHLRPGARLARVESKFERGVERRSRFGTAAGRHRTHGLFVIAEVALAVILLTGAGLMWQSFLRLQAVDPGFKPQRVAAFDVALNGARYDSAARQRQFYRDARERLGKVPGVRAAAAISNLPLDGNENVNFLFVEGRPAPPAEKVPLAENRKITPGYFETMGVALLRGRDFTDQDAPDQPNVCIINETIARTFFPGANPIGQRLKMARTDEEQHPWFTIIGVARDVRSYGLEVKPRPQIYTDGGTKHGQ